MMLRPLWYTWPIGLFFQNTLVEYIGVLQIPISIFGMYDTKSANVNFLKNL